MKNRPYIFRLIMLLFIFSAANGFAFGSKEKPAKNSMEEERKVNVFILNSRTGNTARTAATTASAWLFQEFSTSGGGVSVNSSRRFSMPIGDTEQRDRAGELVLLELSLDLIPENPVSYTNEKNISVEFELAELYSGSRIRMQPAQKAVLDALGAGDKKTGIVRVISMDYSRSGTFKAVVQTADIGE